VSLYYDKKNKIALQQLKGILKSAINGSLFNNISVFPLKELYN
jgi:hypothetical protein